jgi:SAM-dependent methyltransferase
MTTNAERRVARREQAIAALATRLDALVPLAGADRALDVGAGVGTLAFALARHVSQVVAVEVDEELAERARADAPANVEVLVADGERLPLQDAGFDIGATSRTLHHTRRPELMVAELARVTRRGGTVLVIDQLAPSDPLAAIELLRFEQARDPSTTRLLSDGDLRALFDVNGLRLRRSEILREPRELGAKLELPGCEGAERERARGLAPRNYEGVVGWYVLER